MSQHLPVSQKLPPPRTSGRIFLKILLYFVGFIIAWFGFLVGILRATGSNSAIGCLSSLFVFFIFIAGIFVFFSKKYYLHCLPGLRYLWWILGATSVFFILFVTLFGTTNPNTNPIADAIAISILVLYGISLMIIAYLKPSLAQQVNESVYRILRAAPRKQLAASDLSARLQREYKQLGTTAYQYLENLAYIELINMQGVPEMICRIKQQKPSIARSSMTPTPVSTLYPQTASTSFHPPIPMNQYATTPAVQYTPPGSQKSQDTHVSLADQKTVPDLPTPTPGQKPAIPPVAVPPVHKPPIQPVQSVVPPSSQSIDTPMPLPNRTVPTTPVVSHSPTSSSPVRKEQVELPVQKSPIQPVQGVVPPSSQSIDTPMSPPKRTVPPTPVVSHSPKPSLSSAKEQKAIQIFCCYAHEDERLLDKLKTHLKPQQRQGLIQIWHDRDISAGAEWEKEIEQQLNSAQVILLLVSPDFMASDYCYNKEMQRVLERHARGEVRAIPIILRPTDWRITPLGKLQALPKDGKPITTWSNSDIAYLDVATSIRTIIETLLTPPQQSQKQKQVQPRNIVQNQKTEAEVELIRTRCSQGKLVVTNKKIAVELTTFGKVIKSQMLLRSSLTSIDSKVVVFPLFGAGGGMNLIFHGRGRELVKAELVPFKEAQEVLALLS